MDTAPRDRPITVYCPKPVGVPDDCFSWPEDAIIHVMPAHWHEPDDRTDDQAGWYAPWVICIPGVWDDPMSSYYHVELQPTHWLDVDVPILIP